MFNFNTYLMKNWVLLVFVFVITKSNIGYSQCSAMQNPFVDFSISHDPQPSPVDLDNDGDQDLVVGGDGQLSYLENLGNGIYRDLTNTGDNVLPVLSFLDMSVSFCDLDGDLSLIHI